MAKNHCASRGELSRREFCRRIGVGVGVGSALGAGGIAVPRRAFGIVRSDRPGVPCGVAAGDVVNGAAIVWSRTDRPASLVVEYDTTEAFRDPTVIVGPAATPITDFTAQLPLTGLPRGETVFYRVTFEDLDDRRSVSAPVVGSFRTSSEESTAVRFAWSGDTAGQGFGINPDFGGMKIYESIRQMGPDFFVHSGDNIYADGPIPETIALDDGTTWRNVTTEAKSKVAETLDEFRGNYRYNLMDENLRRFQAEVPLYVQWDDHETTNNWYPDEILEDPRYTTRSCALLSARARRAFLEYVPLRTCLAETGRVFRSYQYGPDVEVFLLDCRSYRGPNTANDQPTKSELTAYLGSDQLRWLKGRLAATTARWKLVFCDMPVGLVIGDAGGTFENCANGDGPPLGRELEIAELLAHIARNEIRNVVWFTADVHYAAAHHYDPSRAVFQRFLPFWEFVAGPLNAGTFGPGRLENTFGPEARFVGIPEGMKPNRPPSEGFQFFGSGQYDPESGSLTVGLHNIEGETIYEIELPAEA